MKGLAYLAGALFALSAIAAPAIAALTVARPAPAAVTAVLPVKVGIQTLDKTQRADLWRRVDEYATVDALQEFCGNKLNIPKRAWNAVAACVEVKSLRRVLSVFRTKKAEYLKAWETLHGEEERKKAVCERFKTKLGEYSKIISGQIKEAATMCRNCFFC